MSNKKKKLKTRWENTTEYIDLKKQLAFLKENKQKIHDHSELYFNEKQNEIDLKHYYKAVIGVDFEGLVLFRKYHELVNKTHINQLPYFVSKDLYLYTWVDLRPNGSVKSIYSGEKKNPESLIIQDYELITQKYDEFQQFLQRIKQNEFASFKELKAVEWKLKMNTEHIVPQSWFNALEPMKGDLHHLFICDPECNIARSNFPYEDFNFYQPESPEETVQNRCGVAEDGRFEPEYGKGIVARSMMYFLLRYPKAIKKAFQIQINLQLLLNWHREFPVSLYEKHRNQTIYRIQGNRNPFIDFPDLSSKLEFPIN